MKSIFYLLFFLIPALIFSKIRIYKGFLDQYPITLIIKSYSDGVDNAMYVYDKYDTPVSIMGTHKDGKLLLNEKDKNKKVTATLEFLNYNPKNDTLIGKWTDSKTDKQYNITLTKTNEYESYDANEFSNLELLQIESTKNHYFKTIVSKEKNEIPKVIGLKIFEKKTDKLLQSFVLDCENRDFNNIYVGDYNFDKINEFAVFESSYAGPNTSCIYYLYNPKTKKYFKSSFEGTSLEFDSDEKLVYEHNQCCAGSYHMNASYKVINNKMVLIKKECMKYDDKKEDFVVVKCD